MKTSTRYLAKTLLRRAWLAVLAGVILAGGFYLLRGRPAAAPAPAESAAPTAFVLEENAAASRFAFYKIEESAEPEEEPAAELSALGVNERANSLCTYAVARLQTDSNRLMYYTQILKRFPALDPSLFSLDDMRSVLFFWNGSYDVVLRIDPPAVSEALLQQASEVFGLPVGENQADAVVCLLRDAIFDAVTGQIASGDALRGENLTLSRSDASAEEMMSLQYLLSTGADVQLAAKQGVLVSDNPDQQPTIGKKKLALLFLIGFCAVEAVVLLLALLDRRVKDAKELAVNTDLTVLQTVPDAASPLTEAALRLDEAVSPVLLGVGISSEEAESLACSLESGVKALSGTEASVTALVASDDSMDWLLKAHRRPVVLAVKCLQTTYPQLQTTAERLRLGGNEVYGAVVLSDRKG